jgi:hypothetical protein
MIEFASHFLFVAGGFIAWNGFEVEIDGGTVILLFFVDGGYFFQGL